MDFANERIRTWQEFVNLISRRKPGSWVYRGQRRDWNLETTLERSLRDWGINLKRGREIETQLIRDFRRRYHCVDHSLIENDTLYCLALMQHHGAPTRLLDFTYSPYIAAKFAIESVKNSPVIWAINAEWIHSTAKKIVGEDYIKKRNCDTSRNDTSFCPLYMDINRTAEFVHLENPFYLNKRLIIQQGVFLCAGNVNISFCDNLKNMKGWDDRNNVVKLDFALGMGQIRKFIMMLDRMNVDSSVLFPGVDGIARSLREQVFRYSDLANARTGNP
jgi:hypothetical protein